MPVRHTCINYHLHETNCSTHYNIHPCSPRSCAYKSSNLCDIPPWETRCLSHEMHLSTNYMFLIKHLINSRIIPVFLYCMYWLATLFRPKNVMFFNHSLKCLCYIIISFTSLNMSAPRTSNNTKTANIKGGSKLR